MTGLHVAVPGVSWLQNFAKVIRSKQRCMQVDSASHWCMTAVHSAAAAGHRQAAACNQVPHCSSSTGQQRSPDHAAQITRSMAGRHATFPAVPGNEKQFQSFVPCLEPDIMSRHANRQQPDRQ